MADRIPSKTITVPAGTAIATPQTTQWTINPGHVERLDVYVPPGPSGLMGFAVLFAGVQVFPDDAGSWFVMDNVYTSFPLQNQPTDGRWSVRAYNIDVYDHTFYLWLLVNELTAPLQVGLATIPIG